MAGFIFRHTARSQCSAGLDQEGGGEVSRQYCRCVVEAPVALDCERGEPEPPQGKPTRRDACSLITGDGCRDISGGKSTFRAWKNSSMDAANRPFDEA